jgi:RES domain
VTLYRAFAWDRAVGDSRPDGPLWFPRRFQGEGRHDNPDVYGCLYLADRSLSCVVEQFAPFRGQRLSAALLRRRGLPLALATIRLDEKAEILDLDDPVVLRRERLRPSLVATRERDVTQPQALALFRRYPRAAGLRWWSTWEARWANVTLFDRATPLLRLDEVHELTLEHQAVVDAADWFGMRRA